MAYSTVASTSSAAATAASVIPSDVLTLAQEKEFVRTCLFIGDEDNYRLVNVFMNVFDGDDKTIPLTSVIYTPNRRFFENSKFFHSIGASGGNNNKLMNWLKKHNILVIVYGESSLLDNSLHAPKAFTDSMLLQDVVQTSGLVSSSSMYMATTSSPAAGGSNPTPQKITNNEDFMQLMRLESSPDEFRLQAINERVSNVYSFNFSPINYLIFNDLNNDNCIVRFMKNTINVSLMG